jgi:hypothetical protein
MAQKKARTKGASKRVVDLAEERERRAEAKRFAQQEPAFDIDDPDRLLMRAANLLEYSKRGSDRALAELIWAATLPRQPLPLSAIQAATELLTREGERSWKLEASARPWVRILRAAFLAGRNGEDADRRAWVFRFVLESDKINPSMFTSEEIETLCTAMRGKGKRGDVAWKPVWPIFVRHGMRTDTASLQTLWKREHAALKAEAKALRDRNR